MKIAVDIRGNGEYTNFINETFKIIVSQQPGHTFIFIYDKPFDPTFVTSENVIKVVIKQTQIELLLQLAMASFLKQHKPDVLVTGKTLKTKFRQCLVANDQSDTGCLKRAERIIAQSKLSKTRILKKFKIVDNRIDVVYKGINKYLQGIEAGEREKVKEMYAGGNEYFFALPGSYAGLVNLLKAFSVFKKMQKSHMHLLIAPQTESSKEFSRMLHSYKFKSEVKLLDNTVKQTLVQLMSLAYAVILPFECPVYTTALNVINCNVPVIANNDDELLEVCGDVLLYVNASEPNDIGDKLMQVYKDENLRRQLIEKGRELVEKYNWDNSADSLWKSIEKACG